MKLVKTVKPEKLPHSELRFPAVAPSDQKIRKQW